MKEAGSSGLTMAVDILENRRARKWGPGELAVRVLWGSVQPLFRLSPRVFWGWRRSMLRLFGARIGHHVHIHPSVRVMIPWNLTIGDLATVGDSVRIYNLGAISIGERTCISQGSHLCAGTHDYRKRDMPLVKSPIRVGEDVWVCADAFIGPGVTVGDFAVVSARAVVMRDVPRNAIVGGNPAAYIKDRPVLT
jgi:putative colanic acid biosynthesis acetyltransferase WcaF